MYLSASEIIGIMLLLVATVGALTYAAIANAKLEREIINLRRLNRAIRQGLTRE